MHIVDVGPDDPLLDLVWPVMHELRTHLDPGEFRARFAAMHDDEGYRLAALFDGDACLAVAGYRVQTSMFAGRHVYVDDLVTAESARSGGCGKALIEHIVEIARADGCATVQLDSGTHRARAHRFYFREGFSITSYHFARSTDP